MSIKNVVPLLNVSAMFSFQEFVKPVTVLESDCQKILKRRNEDERVHGGSPTKHLLNVLLTYVVLCNMSIDIHITAVHLMILVPYS